ncbi:hypothetical protein A6R68_21916, partial [Neotoma lepida]
MKGLVGPFYIEPTNIVNVNDVTQRVSDHASAMNKRIHYYSRLTTPADKALIAPDHVVPAPEECYVYSPLGSAYKLQSYTEGYGKNTSFFYDLEYHDGNIYTKYSLGHKTGWIYYWDVCHHADGPFNTLLLLQSGEITEYDRYIGHNYLGISRCLQTLFWLFWTMVKSPFLLDFIHHISDTDTILGTNNSNPGTVSVLYLIFLVTLKAIRLGFHLEFHWFAPTEFFVP